MNRKTIAVAMIVKNEEALLARCLESVKEADAIYIADTGSVDGTIEIARRYTDKIFLGYIWDDNFAGARNYIKAQVKEDVILSIDADEYLDVPFDEVRKAAELMKDMGTVKMQAEGSNPLIFNYGRLFRNSPDIYWVQPIHNHLSITGEGEKVGDIRIIFGWSPAHQRDPDRALRILERVVAADGHAAGRNLYYLGREYWYKQRKQECVETLIRYVNIDPSPAEKSDAFFIMSQAFSAMGKDDDARHACAQAIVINSNFKEAIQWMAGISTPENAMQWKRMARTANNNNIMWDRMPAKPVHDVLFISTHNDDESLFGAFSLMRNKPLVIIVTTSHIQPNRGDKGCDAYTRNQETINAMKLAGCPVVFLGIKDTELTEDILRERLLPFNPETVYIPALQGGNPQHDLVHKVAIEIFGHNKCEQYCTYTKTELYTTGSWEIKPTPPEMELKNKMLDCYKSQINLPSTRPHFEAVRNKSEWLL